LECDCNPITQKGYFIPLLDIRKFTAIKGCASHSDFQSEQDKLDDLDIYLDEELERASQFNAMRNFTLLEVKRKVKELRQKAGE
jgi:hypothetical protein